MIGELLEEGLLHKDVKTVAGYGLEHYTREPALRPDGVRYSIGPKASLNSKILRPAKEPFHASGGLRELKGNLGRSVMKVSAVSPENQRIKARARVFDDQGSVKQAFKDGEFTEDTIVIVRFQGPKSNGMPELHSLTPSLSVLQSRGLKIALVTDGRMSGASGKVPSAIHLSPEAAVGGPLARIRDGDRVLVDATAGRLECLEPDFDARKCVIPDLSANCEGLGRELFSAFRKNCGHAIEGAGAVV